MRYIDFRNAIQKELRRKPAGLAWKDLKKNLRLPYERPCPAWVKCLEKEIALKRIAGPGRAHLWTIRTTTGGRLKKKTTDHSR